MTHQEFAHASAARRWETLTLMEQLAHVGSEVERTIRAHAAGNSERFDRALSRALELFDLTARDNRWRGPRRREILRAREEFCRLFFDDGVPNGSADGLRRYLSRIRGGGAATLTVGPHRGAAAPAYRAP